MTLKSLLLRTWFRSIIRSLNESIMQHEGKKDKKHKFLFVICVGLPLREYTISNCISVRTRKMTKKNKYFFILPNQSQHPDTR